MLCLMLLFCMPLSIVFFVLLWIINDDGTAVEILWGIIKFWAFVVTPIAFVCDGVRLFIQEWRWRRK